MISHYPWTALATLAALAVYFTAGARVAGARREHGIKAPATTGHPEFERAFRAQQNVLEWLPLLLPAMWLFALAIGDGYAAALGLVWSGARLGYIFAYASVAEKRVPFFLAQMAIVVMLWLGALLGTIRALI